MEDEENVEEDEGEAFALLSGYRLTTSPQGSDAYVDYDSDDDGGYGGVGDSTSKVNDPYAGALGLSLTQDEI